MRLLWNIMLLSGAMRFPLDFEGLRYPALPQTSFMTLGDIFTMQHPLMQDLNPPGLFLRSDRKYKLTHSHNKL